MATGLGLGTNSAERHQLAAGRRDWNSRGKSEQARIARGLTQLGEATRM